MANEVKPLSLVELVADYAAFRKLKTPNKDQAFKWLCAEMGELAEADVVGEQAWVRNNPNKEPSSVADEIGDVLMMLTRYAAAQGLDPLECMKIKWQRKGWVEQ